MPELVTLIDQSARQECVYTVYQNDQSSGRCSYLQPKMVQQGHPQDEIPPGARMYKLKQSCS